jgi:hypothetical protein
VAFSAAITAASSPTWFDCASPGMRIAMLFWLLGPNHTPLPHWAFCLPLLMQALSV